MRHTTATPTPPAILLHTPGPFTFCRDSDGCDDLWTIKSVTTGQGIACITFWDCDECWADRALADARLLAAAPQLLDALKRVTRILADLPSGLRVEAYEAECLAIAAVNLAERGE